MRLDSKYTSEVGIFVNFSIFFPFYLLIQGLPSSCFTHYLHYCVASFNYDDSGCRCYMVIIQKNCLIAYLLVMWTGDVIYCCCFCLVLLLFVCFIFLFHFFFFFLLFIHYLRDSSSVLCMSLRQNLPQPKIIKIYFSEFSIFSLNKIYKSIKISQNQSKINKKSTQKKFENS